MDAPFDAAAIEEPDDVPLVATWRWEPWAAVIGGDTPMFVLYESGRVIWMPWPEADGGGRREATLTPDAAIALRDELLDLGMDRAPRHFGCCNCTDQNTLEIMVRADDGWRISSGYAVRRTDQQRTPRAFRRPYERILGFTRQDSVAWSPAQIELLVWGYGHARGSVPWPSGVPEPSEDPWASGRSMYSERIDAEHRATLDAALKARPTTSAFALGDALVSVSYRLPLDGESYLREVLELSRR